MMINRTIRYSALALALSLPLAACESTTGADGAEVSVRISSAGGSASLAPAFSAAALSEAMNAPVSLSDVKSIDVTVTRVDAMSRDSARADSGWVSLTASSPVSVNLLALPTTETSGVQLARGTVPAGSYTNVRLFYSAATITFSKDVTVSGGGNTVYKANTAYPLKISSGMQSGIKVPTAGLTVTDGATSTVSLVFSPSVSVSSIQATGQGLQMSPVLSAHTR